MNLKDDKQQNIQMQLDFSSVPTGEAREAGREGTESSGAMNGTENPASTNRLMEAVCERENLKAALQRVKANKGMRGWRSYFGFCETPEVLIGLTRWVRLRLRAALWRQWKTPRRRRAALIELGVRPRLASNTAGSGRGPWYLAKAQALAFGLSNAYFRSLGLPSLFEEC